MILNREGDRLKKFTAVFMTGLSLLCFTSCDSNQQSAPPLTVSPDKDCIVKYGGEEYKCSIKYISSSVESITVKSPENISGMTFRYSDGKFTLSYGTLICKSENLLLPESSFPYKTSAVLKKLRKNKNTITFSLNENGEYTYKDEVSDFTVKADKNGVLKEIIL